MEIPVILFISHLASIKPEINFYFHDYENILDDAVACMRAQIKRKIGKKIVFFMNTNIALRLYPKYIIRYDIEIKIIGKNMIHL